MKVVYADGFRKRRIKVSIDEAIRSECRAYHDHGSGQLENMSDDLARTQMMLGRLVEMLHKKGVLGNMDVMELLGPLWEKARD